jgi:hypothetical protein
MKSTYDKDHRDVEFAVGDWAWLRLNHRSAVGITTGSNHKLAPRYYGPFQVLERIGSVAYRLLLPPELGFMMFSMSPSSRSTMGRLLWMLFPYQPLRMVVLCLLLRRSSVLILCITLGIFSSNGLAAAQQKLHGSHWRISRSGIQRSSLRTSCFPRTAEVSWTTSLARNSGADRRVQPQLELVVEF